MLAESFLEENQRMTTFLTFVETKAVVPLTRPRKTNRFQTLGGTTSDRPSIFIDTRTFFIQSKL